MKPNNKSSEISWEDLLKVQGKIKAKDIIRYPKPLNSKVLTFHDFDEENPDEMNVLSEALKDFEIHLTGSEPFFPLLSEFTNLSQKISEAFREGRYTEPKLNAEVIFDEEQTDTLGNVLSYERQIASKFICSEELADLFDLLAEIGIRIKLLSGKIPAALRQEISTLKSNFIPKPRPNLGCSAPKISSKLPKGEGKVKIKLDFPEDWSEERKQAVLRRNPKQRSVSKKRRDRSRVFNTTKL